MNYIVLELSMATFVGFKISKSRLHILLCLFKYLISLFWGRLCSSGKYRKKTIFRDVKMLTSVCSFWSISSTGSRLEQGSNLYRGIFTAGCIFDLSVHSKSISRPPLNLKNPQDMEGLLEFMALLQFIWTPVTSVRKTSPWQIQTGNISVLLKASLAWWETGL